MQLDDGAANRQAHAHAFALGREKGLAQAGRALPAQARPVVGDLHAHGARLARPHRDAHAPRLRLQRQRITGVAHEVGHHLLDEHGVGHHGRQRVAAHVDDLDLVALDVALEQAERRGDHGVQVAQLALGLAPCEEIADALDDAGRRPGLLALALQGLDDRLGHVCAARQGIEHAGVVAGDGRQRLVEFVRQGRGHLAQHGQARVVGHGLHLAALAFFEVLALGDVHHRGHPADLRALGIDQRRLVDHHLDDAAIGVLPARLVAPARGLAGHVAQVAGHALVHLLGHPVGHGRQQADQLFRLAPHHVGHGLVDIDQAAFEVAGADAHGQGVFHRGAPGRFGAPGLFGPRDAAHLLAQHDRGQADQAQEAAHQGHRQGAPPGRDAVARRQLQPGIGQAGAQAHAVPGLARIARAFHRGRNHRV